MTYLLNEAKTQCKKTFGERKVLHMCINKYIADQKFIIPFLKILNVMIFV